MTLRWGAISDRVPFGKGQHLSNNTWQASFKVLVQLRPIRSTVGERHRQSLLISLSFQTHSLVLSLLLYLNHVCSCRWSLTGCWWVRATVRMDSSRVFLHKVISVCWRCCQTSRQIWLTSLCFYKTSTRLAVSPHAVSLLYVSPSAAPPPIQLPHATQFENLRPVVLDSGRVWTREHGHVSPTISSTLSSSAWRHTNIQSVSVACIELCAAVQLCSSVPRCVVGAFAHSAVFSAQEQLLRTLFHLVIKAAWYLL